MANIFVRQTSSKTLSFVSLIGLFIFLPLLLVATYQTARLISRAAGFPANITVDASTVFEPIKTDFYHAFAQGGEEPTDMLAPVFDDVKALKPKFIRLDHIYDYFNVVSKSGETLSFDFSKLDQSVNTIVKLGATPVLALSFMPAPIAEDGVIINKPNNWDDWSTVVQKTIEHYSGKTEKNLTGIYYEVWNEPDLDQFGKWSYKGDEKNYLHLYKAASKGAKSAQNVNQFFLGGPATTGLYKNWILAMIELAQKGARVDFLSWHSYLADPDRYAQDQTNIAKWLLATPQYALLPKLITEFGFTGAKDVKYGTNYASAYTAAAIRQMITAPPAAAFAFQPKDGPGQEKGDGWGFITHETNVKRFKPRYYVFNFIDKMTGNRVDLKGEGSWVTGFASTKDNVLRIFLVNFDQRGTHSEAVPLTINNLKPGTYNYKEIFLQGKENTFRQTTTEGKNKIIQITKKILMPAQSVLIIELVKI